MDQQQADLVVTMIISSDPSIATSLAILQSRGTEGTDKQSDQPLTASMTR
jgi:hypothetical protein